jgi:hypothetical protein
LPWRLDAADGFRRRSQADIFVALLNRLLAMDLHRPDLFMPDNSSGCFLAPDFHMPDHLSLSRNKMLVPFVLGEVADINGVNRVAGQNSDSLGTKTLDDKAAVIETVAIANHAVMPDELRAFRSEHVAAQVALPIMIGADEAKIGRSQAEIDIEDSPSVPAQTHSGNKARGRRQRCPADESLCFVMPPGDP